jgi:hypothetical protein
MVGTLVEGMPQTNSGEDRATTGGTLSESPGGRSVLEAALGTLPVPAYTNDIDGFVTWENDAALALPGTFAESTTPRPCLRKSWLERGRRGLP